MAEGRCLCGAVRYTVEGPYVRMLNCHCSMCRKHHGSAFATFVTAPLAAVQVGVRRGERGELPVLAAGRTRVLQGLRLGGADRRAGARHRVCARRQSRW